MTFNDYVINLNLQVDELKRLDELKIQLQDILELHEAWIHSAFSRTYNELISPNRSSGGTESNALINLTKNHFLVLREKLISIDFLEFGEILSNFNNKGLQTLKDKSEQIVKEYKESYCVVHSYKACLEDTKRVSGYVNCINAIRKMSEIYDKFLFMSLCVNDINKQLSLGCEEEGLEISLLNDRFEKETYLKVTDPVYLIYEKLCEISNIDSKKEPLQIVRMETGSFFIKFIGNKGILKLISNIFESFHKIIIRNYTREGQKQNLVESTELFKEQFDIVKEMIELGMDVDEHKEIAKETLVLLMKQSNILLSSSPDVRINKKVLSKSDDIKKALIQNELKTLPFSDDEDEIVNK